MAVFLMVTWGIIVAALVWPWMRNTTHEGREVFVAFAVVLAIVCGAEALMGVLAVLSAISGLALALLAATYPTMYFPWVHNQRKLECCNPENASADIE